MKSLINYSNPDQFDLLVDVSRGWTQTYNIIRDIAQMSSIYWEIKTIDDLILSEKVFDV